MTDRCIGVEHLLEPTNEDRRHLSQCADCVDLARDVAEVRKRAAVLDPQGWADDPAPTVDVEAALASVFRQADLRSRPSRRQPFLVQFATSLAAAAVLFSVAAPSLLRWRVESAPTAQAKGGGVALQGIFWTTVSSER